MERIGIGMDCGLWWLGGWLGFVDCCGLRLVVEVSGVAGVGRLSSGKA